MQLVQSLVFVGCDLIGLRSLRRARIRARAADGRSRRGVDRRRLRGAAGRGSPASARSRGHPRHREGRRLRRYLVLEPLSGRGVRHRVVRLPAAARRARLHPQGEVQPRAGDLRSLQGDRREVRPLPRRLLPDRSDRDALG